MASKFNRLKYELKKTIWKRNSMVRRYQTKRYSTKKVVIGQTNDADFPKDWLTIDYSNADYNIDLNSDYALPFQDESIELLYSAHCLEHLFEDKVDYVAKEAYRVLSHGGKIRIEVPDVKRIISHYQSMSSEYTNEFEGRYGYMCSVLGYDDKYLEPHIGMLGTISNYFDDGVDYQIPVYATKEMSDEKLSRLTLDKFCEWCVSLQSEKQLESPGHKAYLYFEKIERILQNAGFRIVREVEFDQSNYDQFKLNQTNKKSIQEKPHRQFYSMYIEAEK
jgi:SAM-dependent methyltransferase